MGVIRFFTGMPTFVLCTLLTVLSYLLTVLTVLTFVPFSTFATDQMTHISHVFISADKAKNRENAEFHPNLSSLGKSPSNPKNVGEFSGVQTSQKMNN